MTERDTPPAANAATMRIIGIGNELQRDDGFGPVVARALADAATLPAGVTVQDYGARVVHLAFDLAEFTGTTVFVDAADLGAEPGTVRVLVPTFADDLPPANGHGLDLSGVIATVRSLGGQLDDVVLVGCQPLDLTDGVGLTPVVEGAVQPAIEAIVELAVRHADGRGRLDPHSVAPHRAQGS